MKGNDSGHIGQNCGPTAPAPSKIYGPRAVRPANCLAYVSCRKISSGG